MNTAENVREGFRSIKANLLRSILTALIVAIGITSLIGILTAIDGISASVADSFSSLGVNSFQIRSKSNQGRRGGVKQKTYPEISYRESLAFIENYSVSASVGLSVNVTNGAEIKRGSKKTNPNVRVVGGNDQFLAIENINLSDGRNVTSKEAEYGSLVAIVGQGVIDQIFDKNEQPINDFISFAGNKYKVIGIIQKRGAIEGNNNPDNTVIVPLQHARVLASGRSLRFNLAVATTGPVEVEYAINEARGLMRAIRQDPLGEEDSFEIRKSNYVEEELSDITGFLKAGGFGIGFITLLGASIGLMNIMMVSVTERTKEIGIRKAVGATPLKIRRQFIMEAVVVCILGGVLGVILGMVVGNLVSNFIFPGSFIVPWGWIVIGFLICVFVGVISGYYPAFKASKVDPIESLRFE